MTRVNEEVEVEVVEEVKATAEVIESMDCPEGHTSFSVSKNGKKAELSYNFGQDLASMVELFGEAVVFDQAKANMIVRAQSVARARVAKGEKCAEVLAIWKPGEKLVAAPKDPEQAAMAFLENASAEKLAEMLAALENKG